MRIWMPIVLCLSLAGGAAAQRGGGMAGGGGGMRGGGGGTMTGPPRGGAASGGLRGGSGPGYASRSGAYNFFRDGIHDGYGTRFAQSGGYYLPYGNWGWSLGYFPGYYGYDAGYPHDSSGYTPNVMVVYPQAQAEPAVQTVYVERARPVLREYDSSGQERPTAAAQMSSPIYLFAFQDHSIAAASSYRVESETLRYVTLQQEEKRVPLRNVDREFTLRLNLERRVTLQLPE
jgi:hypothetical protein